MERGGKVVFIEGDEFHRAHSGSKGGAASNNAGPLIDLALLSEAPVSDKTKLCLVFFRLGRTHITAM